MRSSRLTSQPKRYSRQKQSSIYQHSEQALLLKKLKKKSPKFSSFFTRQSIAGASLQTSSFQDALFTKKNPNILLQRFIHKNIHMYFNQCVNELLIVIKKYRRCSSLFRLLFTISWERNIHSF